MSRLIDADELVAKIITDCPGFMDGGSTITKAFILAMINTRSITPTVKDAEQVVHCRDCKYWKDLVARKDQTAWLPCMEVKTQGEWFCGSGKKKVKIE